MDFESFQIHKKPNAFVEFGKFDLPNSVVYPYVNGVMSELAGILREEFENFDFYFYSCNHSNPPHHPLILRPSRRKRVLFYFSNDQSLEVPDKMAAAFFAVFKHHLKQDVPSKRIYAFPHGYCEKRPPNRWVPPSERRFVATFCGAVNQHRIDFFHQLSALRAIPGRIAKRFLFRLPRRWTYSELYELGNCSLQFNPGWNEGLAKEDYFRQMLHSVFSFCLHGYNSPESFRVYEAASLGSIPVCPTMPSTHLYQNAPILQCEGAAEALQQMRQLLEDPTALEERSRSVRRFWEDRWSEASVARFLASVLT